MAGDGNVASMKSLLRAEVASFFRHNDRRWKAPVVATVRQLAEAGVRGFVFGGTLRSLLVSRVYEGRPGRPRDVDIVLGGSSVDQLRDLFGSLVSRETRFGGLQVRRDGWHFDVWPLQRTWAFTADSSLAQEFRNLPATTFLNVESIAVELVPAPGHPRIVHSGDDQFFKGIIARLVEVNHSDNPFPDLCVLRALVMASTLDFCIGPRLARYIADFGRSLKARDFELLQQKHYGYARVSPDVLCGWVASIQEWLDQKRPSDLPFRLPIMRQLSFWGDLSMRRTNVDCVTQDPSEGEPSTAKGLP